MKKAVGEIPVDLEHCLLIFSVVPRMRVSVDRLDEIPGVLVQKFEDSTPYFQTFVDGWVIGVFCLFTFPD